MRRWPKAKLDRREIDRSKPRFASSHAMILSSRLPRLSSGIAILILTGKPALGIPKWISEFVE
jgi:hypothetical protein